MADAKISALPAVTTPLAGTEVLPIVQSSTTKKVSVVEMQAAPVSAGTANGVVYLNGTKVPSTGSAFNYDGTTVQNTKSANAATALYNATNANAGNVARAAYSFNADTGSGSFGVVSSAWNVDAIPANSTYIYGSHGISLLPATGQNINFYTGNLIQGTAAKGINFTANTPAAGMTSQLLNWYEEGTWTPSFTFASGSVTYTTQTGTYTRIGRLVTLSGYIKIASVSSPTSYALIQNPPFTMGGSQRGAGAVWANGLALTAQNVMAQIRNANNDIWFQTFASGALGGLPAVLQANSEIGFTVTYEI